MFFLNLSLGEFLGLLGVLSGTITALYLLDRAKRRKVVSTLRFWADAGRVDQQRRRKHVREPWSLILQLVSLLMLLLAIAQVQWGTRERRGHDHVLLLDSSSWMGHHTGNRILLDDAKRIARNYLSSLPGPDRVMLVRVDNLSTPATGFTDDRRELSKAVAATTVSYSGLDLRQAFDAASHSLHRLSANPGEIVYIGAEHVITRDALGPVAKAVRVLPVKGTTEDVGIRHVSVRRAEDQPELWRAFIAVRNYGTSSRTLTMKVRFAGSRFAPRRITLGAAEEQNIEYRFSTSSPGTLAVDLEPGDTLPVDDHAEVQLPKPDLLRVAVYTARPELFRPLVDANRRIQAAYFTPQQYNPKPSADVVLLDSIDPSSPPQLPSLWITPPPMNSPVPVTAVENNTLLRAWDNDSSLGAGLHSRELKLSSAEIFAASPSDTTVASTERGPTVVARPSAHGSARLAVVGFDPLHGNLRFELSTPLLFANLLDWLAPESFRSSAFSAGAVGAASIPLDVGEAGGRIRVSDERGFSVPFTVRNGVLELYADHPSTLRIVTNQRERVLSLTLPEIPEITWKPPASASHGVPRTTLRRSPVDFWKWLAVLGGLGLLSEWLFFARQQRPLAFGRRTTQRAASEQEQHELVTK
jgi:hypothetical protein